MKVGEKSRVGKSAFAAPQSLFDREEGGIES